MILVIEFPFGACSRIGLPGSYGSALMWTPLGLRIPSTDLILAPSLSVLIRAASISAFDQPIELFGADDDEYADTITAIDIVMIAVTSTVRGTWCHHSRLEDMLTNATGYL